MTFTWRFVKLLRKKGYIPINTDLGPKFRYTNSGSASYQDGESLKYAHVTETSIIYHRIVQGDEELLWKADAKANASRYVHNVIELGHKLAVSV